MARLLNGTSDRISIAGSLKNSPTSETIAAWLNADFKTSGGTGCIFGRRFNSSLRGSEFLWFGGNALKVILTTNASGNDYTWVPSYRAPTTKSYLHFAVSYNELNGVLSLYVNGQFQESITVTGGASPLQQAVGPLGIGAVNDNGTWLDFIPGTLAHVGFWNQPLDAAEIALLGAGLPPSNVEIGNLIGYWPLDGLSSLELDWSGNNNHGVLTGTSWAEDPLIDYFSEDDDRIVFQGGAPSTPGFFSRYYYDMPAGARLAA